MFPTNETILKLDLELCSTYDKYLYFCSIMFLMSKISDIMLLTAISFGNVSFVQKPFFKIMCIEVSLMSRVFGHVFPYRSTETCLLYQSLVTHLFILEMRNAKIIIHLIYFLKIRKNHFIETVKTQAKHYFSASYQWSLQRPKQKALNYHPSISCGIFLRSLL